jgi:hypothetical protein
MAIRLIHINDTRHIRLTVSDERAVSGIYDLSQAQTVELAIGTCPTGALEVFSFPAASVTVGPPANGELSLTLTPAQTSLIPEGKHELRVRVIEPDGDRYTVYSELVAFKCAML